MWGQLSIVQMSWFVTRSATADDRVRIERMDNEHFEYCEALEVVSSFYGEEEGASCQSGEKQDKGVPEDRRVSASK